MDWAFDSVIQEKMPESNIAGIIVGCPCMRRLKLYANIAEGTMRGGCKFLIELKMFSPMRVIADKIGEVSLTGFFVSSKEESFSSVRAKAWPTWSSCLPNFINKAFASSLAV